MDPWIQDIRAKIGEPDFTTKYVFDNAILLHQGRLYLSLMLKLQIVMLEELHSSRVGGHTGYTHTLSHVRQHFFWVSMNKFVRDFVIACSVCQQTKSLAVNSWAYYTPFLFQCNLGGLEHGFHHGAFASKGPGSNCGSHGLVDKILSYGESAGQLLCSLCCKILHQSYHKVTWHDKVDHIRLGHSLHQ